ncbi:MAG: hypothetical protein M5U32_15290 [Myxococcota bacterium]|nr:hypothetical protein [Myxococcota bacterium]
MKGSIPADGLAVEFHRRHPAEQAGEGLLILGGGSQEGGVRL